MASTARSSPHFSPRRRVPTDDFFADYLHGLSTLAAHKGAQERGGRGRYATWRLATGKRLYLRLYLCHPMPFIHLQSNWTSALSLQPRATQQTPVAAAQACLPRAPSPPPRQQCPLPPPSPVACTPAWPAAVLPRSAAWSVELTAWHRWRLHRQPQLPPVAGPSRMAGLWRCTGSRA